MENEKNLMGKWMIFFSFADITYIKSFEKLNIDTLKKLKKVINKPLYRGK